MERLDIAEEIARLKGHVQHFRDTLQSGEEIGRKLDFIIQEMVRETNTIASKSNDLLISERAIQIKVDIEKMRDRSRMSNKKGRLFVVSGPSGTGKSTLIKRFLCGGYEEPFCRIMYHSRQTATRSRRPGLPVRRGRSLPEDDRPRRVPRVGGRAG